MKIIRIIIILLTFLIGLVLVAMVIFPSVVLDNEFGNKEFFFLFVGLFLGYSIFAYVDSKINYKKALSNEYRRIFESSMNYSLLAIVLSVIILVFIYLATI